MEVVDTHDPRMIQKLWPVALAVVVLGVAVLLMVGLANCLSRLDTAMTERESQVLEHMQLLIMQL